MVNGAGLAMATMDIKVIWKELQFFDVGGGASKEKVNSFKPNFSG